MGKKVVETEVRAAVRDYLQELIGDRTGAGKGMALSANDLMTAARKGGQKVSGNKTEASAMLEAILEKNRRPPSPVITRPPGYMNGTAASRSKSVEPGKRPKTDIYKYHWMVWKTGFTPTPATPSSAPGTPDTRTLHPRPGTATSRPPSARPPSRPTTPYRPATPCRPATPAARPETPYDLTADDTDEELVRISCRNPTPDVMRSPTPAEALTNIREILSPSRSSPRIPRPDVNTNYNSNMDAPYTQFMPNLHAWVANADDYEKAVAYNLLKALEGGNPGAPPIIPRLTKPAKPKYEYRPKSAPPPKPRALGRQRIPRPPTAGVRTCIPVWKLYQQADRLNIKDNPMSMQSMGAPAMPVPYKNYINEGSAFVATQKPYRGDFTISPEWVSEEKVRQKVYQQMKIKAQHDKELAKTIQKHVRGSPRVGVGKCTCGRSSPKADGGTNEDDKGGASVKSFAPSSAKSARSSKSGKSPRTSIATRSPRNSVATRSPRTSIATRSPRNSVATRSPRTSVATRSPRASISMRSSKTPAKLTTGIMDEAETCHHGGDLSRNVKWRSKVDMMRL